MRFKITSTFILLFLQGCSNQNKDPIKEEVVADLNKTFNTKEYALMT